MNGISAKSSTRILRSYVNRFAKNEWISGGKYSGVLDANYY